MLACTITSDLLLPNQSGLYHAKNPWETHIYKHQITYKETDMFYKHISWSIDGKVPKDLTIDTETGLISGTILIFNKQDPSMFSATPFEKMKLDGSNWRNVGRPREAYVDFTFIVTRKYNIKKFLTINKLLVTDIVTPIEFDLRIKALETSNTEYELVEETASKEVSIRVIRNNDLDTRMFFIAYLDADTTEVNGEIVKHKLYKNGKAYTKETLEDFINNL